MKNESAYFIAIGEVLEQIENIMQELHDKIDEYGDNPYLCQSENTKLRLWESIYTTTVENFFNK